ncbi:hypothetical protein SBOR_2463 [Sclerotinia borealis F-4128]|uniref:HTH CENPB-type domain-containing protein n=1 Tax=Sclerotinia borealis (strain F-4128) TaxID=1432307 RepID=W9CRM9_SCLBF|nr:hypothetical protein SBOR_2463 [Sclerotinia borealis F-4128]
MSRQSAAKLYNVPETTLRNRMNSLTPLQEYRPPTQKLTKLEEEVILQYILDIDIQGFAPRLSGVEDIANDILDTREAHYVGKLWAHRFVQHWPELKTRFNRVYDFQRALCEDPKLIEGWFRLVSNMQAKYGILDCDFYNFDETGFMMGIICPGMVVTNAERHGRNKAIQPGNREWATAIVCINGIGESIPPFLVIKGKNHLSSWYTESDLPLDWVIKVTNNGWTNNETGLEWIKHFDKHTIARKQGGYRMLVLDGHESHESIAFQEYCKEHNIITLSLPSHSSHITQSFDIECFSVLKRTYGQQIERYIKAYINHITKVEFLIAFKAAYLQSITIQNGLSGFHGAGLIPFDPQAVISKLDIKLQTSTPTRSSFVELDPWVSQIPHNSNDTLSQSTLVKNRIVQYQGSSPISIFETVTALTKGTEILAYEMILISAEIRTLRKANEVLSKRCKAKKSRIR